jgi:hypothetical protein
VEMAAETATAAPEAVVVVVVVNNYEYTALWSDLSVLSPKSGSTISSLVLQFPRNQNCQIV